MPRTPWIGLAALIAMFVIPLLPSWLFEGPRTVKHWPRRHACGNCKALWTEGHMCWHPVDKATPHVRGELRRLKAATDLKHLPRVAGTAVGRSRR